MLGKVTAVLASAAQREVKSNILFSVFHDYISLVCFSTAHWEVPPRVVYWRNTLCSHRMLG